MQGRLAVPDMMAVARARFPHSFTRVSGLPGSPAWAVPAPGALAARPRHVASPSGATRHASAEPPRDRLRLDLPVTVH